MTDAQVRDQLDDNIKANGIGAITGPLLNFVTNTLYKWLKHKPRVVMSGETYQIPAEGEIHFSTECTNKGTVHIQSLPPDNYGTGLDVSRDGVLRVDGVLLNEGIIINDGLIIN